MKTARAFLGLTVGLLAASQSVLAAAPKADVRVATLVAALQAVSPDPLGGRLGLEVSTVATPTLPKTSARRTYAAQSRDADADRQSYLIWKSSQKS